MKVNGSRSRATAPLQLNIPEDERTAFRVKAASRGKESSTPFLEEQKNLERIKVSGKRVDDLSAELKSMA